MTFNNVSMTYPRLTPLMAPWVTSLISQQELLDQAFQQYGSPLNIHHTPAFADNYQSYVAVLQHHELRHQIFFARKANKCKAFVKEAQRIGCGIDTASYRELQQCLDLSFEVDQLVLTAAIKSEKVVRLAVSHQILIVVDNLDECILVNRIAQELRMSARVGVRVSGFHSGGQQLYSRFGFSLDQAMELIIHQIGPDRMFEALRFTGFHFHLNGYSWQERGTALIEVIQCIDALRERDIMTEFIDVGGGFLVNYLAYKEEWHTFIETLQCAVRGQHVPITFLNTGLGFEMIHGQLHGHLQTYPYYNELPREQFLEAMLSYQNSQGEAVASLLRTRDIALRLEPGRSLVDQAGTTLAKVAFRKHDSQNNLLIGLEMNRTQMTSSSADFLIDPLLISSTVDTRSSEPTVGFLVGAYCLEQDILLKRAVVLPRIPAIGDIVCFPNTAGYMMHFFESEAHLFDLATNLVLIHSEDTQVPLQLIEDM